MALRYWPNADPVGKRFKFNDPSFESPWFTVIGVISDIRRQGLQAPFGPEAYLPPVSNPQIEIILRSSVEPSVLIPQVRKAVAEFDKNSPIIRLGTVAAVVADTTADRRFSGRLLGLFALIALLLGAVGIYGVMSCSVAERRREIAIRLALGAKATGIVQMVIRQGLWLSVLGAAIGLGSALALTHLMEGLLYEISPHDPLTFLAVGILLLAVAGFASYLSAYSVARVDPMATLRGE
jgi:putative ABC transport system permease protein